MRNDLVNQIANAVLYEGYILYPYRRSAVKNQQRWNFGVLYPRSYAAGQTGHDAWSMQMECLASFTPQTHLKVSARFLQLVNRDVGQLRAPVPSVNSTDDLLYERVDTLKIGDKTFQSWQEAVEREVSFAPAISYSKPQSVIFSFKAEKKCTPLVDGEMIAAVVVRQNESVIGQLTVSATQQTESISKLRVVLTNRTDFSGSVRDAALAKSLLSAHLVVSLENGEFISLLDPPERARAAACTCVNIGCWPVLVGAEPARDTMLASPIILYDYPQIAAESPGDLFDSTEIDEILSLRILTLTDDEKRDMRAADERSRKILQRTEELQAQKLGDLHGALRK
jgi:hydrogenase maturation protease